MNRLMIGVLSMAAIALWAGAVQADWGPGDSFKMHFPQPPDETGWAVNATSPQVLADDWQCSETGAVKDIHFWGSWKNGVVGSISSFHLSIHADVPEGQGGISYSRPGQQLWEYDVTQFDVRSIMLGCPPPLGWYDPQTGLTLAADHSQYFQYNVILPWQHWFSQEVGTIYWLDISANVAQETEPKTWGWQTADVDKYPDPFTGEHYRDDAVYKSSGSPGWKKIVLGGASQDLAFVITTPEPGTLVLLLTAGLGALAYAWRRRRS